MTKLKIVYLGTPDFAVKPLQALVNSGLVDILAVVTNPDRPVGRKQILTAPPVKVLAQELGIKVYQYNSIKKEGYIDLKSLSPDLLITCAFGQILSQEIIDLAPFGVFNIHGSLLPKYRGASPVQTAILNGDTKTGITIMKTDIGIDTGDIVYQKEIDILESDTSVELFNKLSALGGECIVTAIKRLLDKTVKYVKQDESQASLTKMIKKEDGLIDFTNSASQIVDKIRAYNPYPIAYAYLNGEMIKIHKARVYHGVLYRYSAGEIITCEDQMLLVGTGRGVIEILEIQKSGGKKMPAIDFLRGNKIQDNAYLRKC